MIAKRLSENEIELSITSIKEEVVTKEEIIKRKITKEQLLSQKEEIENLLKLFNENPSN